MSGEGRRPPFGAMDRALAIAFGAYQAGHLVVNGWYMFGKGAEVFPAPDGGWSAQTVEWARGMAIVDFAVAAASVVFVVGFLTRRPWSIPLGLVTTAVFAAATAMFTISVVEIGAFAENQWFYSALILAALPGVVLLGRLLQNPARTITGVGSGRS